MIYVYDLGHRQSRSRKVEITLREPLQRSVRGRLFLA
jgi:CRISPR/Cas system-associated endoribonuclease Cas2